MQRVALINWKNINQDSDLSKIFESFSKPGVVNWLKVVSWWVEAGFAFVPVIREWKSFVVLFELTERLSFDTSGTKKIFIEILEEKIIDWSWNAVDWTWIWYIRASASYPNKNFLALARVENGNIIDERTYVSVRYFLESFNTAGKLVQLESNGIIKESLLPPMNINIKWLPLKTLDWNSYIVANSWKDNYKWNLHDIFDRLYKAEEAVKVKMETKEIVSKDFKITEWRTIYISEINDYNEKDWYLWRWKVLVYRYNYWSTTEKSMIHNLNIKNRNEVYWKLYENNYIDNWQVVFNKQSPDSNWNALDRDQDARFNLEIYKLW